MLRIILWTAVVIVTLLWSCKKEDTTPSNNNNNNTNQNPISDKRDIAVGRYDCKQYVYSKAGAMLQLLDSSAYEIEIQKHPSDTTKIQIYKGSQILLNTSNVQTLTNNNKVLTFDIPAQKMTYQNIERDVTGELYFFTGSNYKHGGYIDSTKVCQFAVNHAADTPNFTIVHRFNCNKK